MRLARARRGRAAPVSPNALAAALRVDGDLAVRMVCAAALLAAGDLATGARRVVAVFAPAGFRPADATAPRRVVAGLLAVDAAFRVVAGAARRVVAVWLAVLAPADLLAVLAVLLAVVLRAGARVAFGAAAPRRVVPVLVLPVLVVRAVVFVARAGVLAVRLAAERAGVLRAVVVRAAAVRVAVLRAGVRVAVLRAGVRVVAARVAVFWAGFRAVVVFRVAVLRAGLFAVAARVVLVVVRVLALPGALPGVLLAVLLVRVAGLAVRAAALVAVPVFAVRAAAGRLPAVARVDVPRAEPLRRVDARTAIAFARGRLLVDSSLDIDETPMSVSTERLPVQPVPQQFGDTRPTRATGSSKPPSSIPHRASRNPDRVRAWCYPRSLQPAPAGRQT